MSRQTILIFQSHVESFVNRPVKLIGARRVVSASIIIERSNSHPHMSLRRTCMLKQTRIFSYVFRMPEHSLDPDRKAC